MREVKYPKRTDDYFFEAGLSYCGARMRLFKKIIFQEKRKAQSENFY
ncbi:MAG: hypothetical protein QM642_01805 [Edaphocola sp.]